MLNINSLARRRGRVDGTVLKRPEADALAEQFLDQADQVRHRTPQPVQAPNHQGIPRFQGLDAGIGSGPVAARSGRLVRIDVGVAAMTPRISSIPRS